MSSEIPVAMLCRFYTLRSVAKLAEDTASGMSNTSEDTEDGETALAQRLVLGNIAGPSHKVYLCA